MAAEKAADGGPPIPDWAAGDAASEAPFVLEVIKDGVPVDEIPLTAARCLVGRAADAVQVPLAHASISRVHACFQRSTDGLLYVADCASSHGSRLNKAPLPALKYVEARDGDARDGATRAAQLGVPSSGGGGAQRTSRFALAVHDARLLLLRLAHREPLHDECGGGSRESNAHLGLYLLQLAGHLLAAPHAADDRARVALSLIHI